MNRQRNADWGWHPRERLKMTHAAPDLDNFDVTNNPSSPPPLRRSSDGANQGGGEPSLKDPWLARHYPMVYAGVEKLPWHCPMTDDLDRVLRECFRAAETRDIVRALIRHRFPWTGTTVEASDDDLERWTGIDASNVARKICQDDQLKMYVDIRRGKARRLGEPIQATTYDLTRFFLSWVGSNERASQPPKLELVVYELEAWANRNKVTVGSVQDAASQALVDTERRLGRALKRGGDLKRIVDRGKELIKQEKEQAQ